jgi:hypothetical protein
VIVFTSGVAGVGVAVAVVIAVVGLGAVNGDAVGPGGFETNPHVATSTARAARTAAVAMAERTTRRFRRGRPGSAASEGKCFD